MVRKCDKESIYFSVEYAKVRKKNEVGEKQKLFLIQMQHKTNKTIE